VLKDHLFVNVLLSFYAVDWASYLSACLW